MNHRKHAESLKSGALVCTHLTRQVFFIITRNVNRTQFCGVLRCLKNRRVVRLTCFLDVLAAVFIVQKVGLVVFNLASLCNAQKLDCSADFGLIVNNICHSIEFSFIVIAIVRASSYPTICSRASLSKLIANVIISSG